MADRSIDQRLAELREAVVAVNELCEELVESELKIEMEITEIDVSTAGSPRHVMRRLLLRVFDTLLDV